MITLQELTSTNLFIELTELFLKENIYLWKNSNIYVSIENFNVMRLNVINLHVMRIAFVSFCDPAKPKLTQVTTK